uniref:Uncharacterized protein n=1 Tax=Rhizophora mucronata TaxID=61149 RepID=A0A2P2QQM3_RHIMU
MRHLQLAQVSIIKLPSHYDRDFFRGDSPP